MITLKTMVMTIPTMTTMMIMIIQSATTMILMTMMVAFSGFFSSNFAIVMYHKPYPFNEPSLHFD